MMRVPRKAWWEQLDAHIWIYRQGRECTLGMARTF